MLRTHTLLSNGAILKPLLSGKGKSCKASEQTVLQLF
jgi:hypothetical protein